MIFINNITLKYEKKRLAAELDAEKRKQELYLKNPKLEEIEKELTSFAISSAKAILNNNSNNNLIDLKNKINNLKKEKIKILSNLNLNEDYLLPKYECPICSDTGYISDGYNTQMCNCLKQELFNIQINKSNINTLEIQNFNTFNINLFSAEKNKEKYNSDLSPKENIIKIKTAAENFINKFENIAQKNLLFTGTTGSGKTFLCNCIANEILKSGKTVLYQTAPVMLDKIIDYKFGKNSSSASLCEDLYNVDLLIIDDLGAENINSVKLTELFNIINTRVLNFNTKCIKTIISTNLSLENLYKNYDERIVSRLIGYYDIYRFFGDDIRQKK
ncbi:MAG: ATP-binding protein [Lachnospiraceae bacterium]|nr:ATP-binding protein [Lachnospiraceae bacterium]